MDLVMKAVKYPTYKLHNKNTTYSAYKSGQLTM